MKAAVRSIFCLAVILIFLSLPTPVSCQDRIAGIIEEIHGPAYWRKDNNEKETRLDRKRHKARILHVGEQLRTGPGGYLQLYLCSGRIKIEKPAPWFRISATNVCPNQAALKEYGNVGGRKRGDQTQIFSPSDHSVVWPDRFVIRWNRNPAKCVISFSIMEPDDHNLLTIPGIDGSLGELNFTKARELLNRYRQSEDYGPLRLRLVDTCANDVFVTFSVLSLKEETTLKENLSHWNKERGTLLFHLGRAYEFERFRIFPLVAEEYEAALKMAPGSRDLLIRTMLAHRSIGNYVREEELKKRLSSGEGVP